MSWKSKKQARWPEAATALPSGSTPEAGESENSSGDKSRSCLPPSQRHQKMVILGVCVFLAAATFLVFGQTLRHEFVNYDDDQYVYENPKVSQGLTLNGIAWAFTHSHSYNWHPLTSVSHLLDCQLYGLKAGGHHLTSVLLHAVAAILLFLVLQQMTSAIWRSAFVAVVFAIHPLRVESVAWVAERKDVLSGVFFMLTLGAYVRYVRHSKSYACYLAVVFLFALGLISKPTLVTLPFVLLLLDYWPLNRLSADPIAGRGCQPGSWAIAQRLILEKLPLFGLGVASCAATLFVQKEGIQSLMTFSLPLRISNAWVSYVTYLEQMIYPVKLVVFYPHTMRLPFWKVALALTLLITISAGVFCLRRKRPYLLVGWLWYLGMLVPMIGIIQVGEQAHADRYTYLSQIGLYLLLTWGAADLSASWRRSRLVLGMAGPAVVVTLIVCATRQTSYWRDSESLWTHTLSCTSDNYIAQNNLGNAFFKTKRMEAAIAHYKKAIQINPLYADAHDNLGNAFFKTGRMDEAIGCYQKAIEINPSHALAHNNLGAILVEQGRVNEGIAYLKKAIVINPNYAHVHDKLGLAFLETGRVDEAIVTFQKAIEINPNYADAYNNLGLALLKAGRMNEAIAHWQRAIKINPNHAKAHNNLGVTFFETGRVDEAIAHWQKAVKINPDYANAHFNLGDAFLKTGRAGEAISPLQKAIEINPRDVAAQNNLGLALLKMGRVDAAIAHWQKAVEINPRLITARNNLAWVLATGAVASLRNGVRAIALAEQSDRLAGGKNPELLGTLAAAYAEAGRFSNAVATTRQALQLATEQNNQALADKLRKELGLYESGLPCRDDGQTTVPTPKSQ